MKRIIYILLCLSFALNTYAQAPLIVNGWKYAAPPGGCADADANAYIADVEAQSGLNLTTTYENAICDLYTNLKAHGTYTKVNSGFLMPYQNANANKVNMITLTPYATFVGSPTHGSSGVVCNGSTQYVDMNVQMDDAAQNSAGLGVWLMASSGNGSFIGVQGSNRAQITNGSGFLSWTINTSSTPGFASVTMTGFLYATRTASGAQEAYRNGSSVETLTTASVAPSSQDIFGGARNNGSGSAENHANCTILMLFQTDGMTDAEALSFYNDLNTFKTAIGL